MREIDLLIVGAGPAGLGAAIEASRFGAKVIIVDDQDRPGGQLLKQIHKFFGSKEHRAGTRGFNIGLDLLDEADKLGVEILLNTKALGIFEDNVVTLLVDENDFISIKAKRIVLATGGIEKSLSFPGWTLPGVITAGAAQTLINIERVLPGKRILMVGSGNVGLIVSYQLLQAGANVVGIVSPSIGGYAVHAGKVMRAGVPIYKGHTIKRAIGTNEVEKVEIVALDKERKQINGSEKILSVDTICLAVGLNPNNHLVRMVGCKLGYYPRLGGFIPIHDDNMETTKRGIYVAGDLTGIEEANTALDEGRLAGICVAESLGYLDDESFKKLKNEVWTRLNNLREGPFGCNRAIDKELIISQTNGEIKNPKDIVYGKKQTFSGDFSIDMLKELPGYPSDERIKKGPVACIECFQEIPCNPCVEACPFGAISINSKITNLPHIDENKCRGCGICIAKCSGQAIFLLDHSYSEDKATVSFPFEYLPYPEVGEKIIGVDRKGNPVTEVEVVKVNTNKNYDKTAIITVSVDKQFIHQVRFIERKEQ